jgi:hypothetical protein
VVRADAATAAGRTIGILVGHPFMVGRLPGHTGARRARPRAAAAAAAEQQQADQPARAADQVPHTIMTMPTGVGDGNVGHMRMHSATNA